MGAPETAAIRDLLERFLAGQEPIETATPRFLELKIAWYEANFLAARRGEPPLSYFEPPSLTPDEQRRMLQLHEAVLECLPIPALRIEWLPVDEDGTA